MSRAPIAWALTLVMAVAGSQVAHAVAYRIVVPHEEERERVLAETGHGYLAYWWLILALGLVILVVAWTAEVLAARSRSGSRLLAWRFALVSIIVFVTQEHLERLTHDGAVPWRAAFEGMFLVALALQLPFALGAYVVARLLLRAARALGGRLAQTPRRRTLVVTVRRPRCEIHARRVAALALGYGERGPPPRLASAPAPQVPRTWKRGAIRNRRQAVARPTGLTALAATRSRSPWPRPRSSTPGRARAPRDGRAGTAKRRAAAR
jgi:hypothetical protein